MARSDTEHLIRQALVVLPAAGLAVGGIAWLSGDSALATIIWGAATLPVAAALAVEIVVSLRRAEVGLDVVALLAMVSALILGETLAGCVVALMYAGGQFLESYAAG
ncbi:MAG: heavy metal translocating P-type ATPase, partial [Bauldia litoralis]